MGTSASPTIADYSTTPGINDSAGDVNFAEGQSPGSVNDSMRQVLADIRAYAENAEWFDFGYTPVYVSATSFTISSDVTARYHVGRRLKLYGSAMGTLYGTISISTYGAPNTTITVILDSGSLGATLSKVSHGIISYLSSSIFARWYEVSGRLYNTSNISSQDGSINGISNSAGRQAIDLYNSDAATISYLAKLRNQAGAVLGYIASTNTGRMKLQLNESSTTEQDGTLNDKSISSSQQSLDLYNSGGSGTRYLAKFRAAGAIVVGSITHDGSSTAYNTSSDYRLKNIVGDFNASIIDGFKIRKFTIKHDPEKKICIGVIAHEAQDIFPAMVTGEKDEVNDNCDPIYQGVDYSKLVPVLIYEIQQLRARLAEAGIK